MTIKQDISAKATAAKTLIDEIVALSEQLSEGISPPMQPFPNIVGGISPIWEADFRQKKYYAADALRSDFAAFCTASGFVFTSPSAKTHVENGSLVTTAANAARITSKGLLIERESTNRIFPSEDFSAWTKDGVTVNTNNATSPDGSVTSDLLVETTSNSYHQVYAGLVAGTTNIPYCSSVFMKSGTLSKGRVWGVKSSTGYYANADLSGGIVSDATLFGSVSGDAAIASYINVLSNGWHRVACAGRIASDTSTWMDVCLLNASNQDQYAGSASSNLLVWGAQFERGNYPTSYIKTTTAAVTRAAESMRRQWTTPRTQASLVIDFYVPNGLPETGSHQVLYHCDSNQNGPDYYDWELYRQDNGVMIARVTVATTTTFDINLGVVPNGSRNRVAMSMQHNGSLIASINGLPAQSIQLTANPINLKWECLGSTMIPVKQWDAEIAYAAVYLSAFPASVLQTLSSTQP